MEREKARKVILALDTGNLEDALSAVRRFGDFVGGFKIGHALVLPNGLGVIETLREAGAKRIFLDLKFHDIPNTVGLAVREAAKHGVWMMTLHTCGGPAMMTAAVEEAKCYPDNERPILLGVSVLTSVDEHLLQDHLGVNRTIEEHMTYLSKLAVECGMDGVVCSPEEVRSVRRTLGHEGIIVTPGIRRADQSNDDQVRVGTAMKALGEGADYLVIGRGLMQEEDPMLALAAFGLVEPTGSA